MSKGAKGTDCRDFQHLGGAKTYFIVYVPALPFIVYIPALFPLLHMKRIGKAIVLTSATAFKAERTSNRPGPNGNFNLRGVRCSGFKEEKSDTKTRPAVKTLYDDVHSTCLCNRSSSFQLSSLFVVCHCSPDQTCRYSHARTAWHHTLYHPAKPSDTPKHSKAN